MEPTFTSRPAFTVVGIKYRGRNDNNEIPALWDSFFPDKAAQIEHKINPHVAYGVEDNKDMATGEFDYMAGYEVPADSPTSAGLERWEIPAQSYAVFATTLPVIRQTYDFVCREWLPQSGYRRVPGPEFELYDQNFDPANGKLDMYLYVPVESAIRE